MCICMSLVAVTLGLFITKCRPQGSSSRNKLCNTYQGKFREKKTRPEYGSAFSVWVEAAVSKLRVAMTGREKKTNKKLLLLHSIPREIEAYYDHSTCG